MDSIVLARLTQSLMASAELGESGRASTVPTVVRTCVVKPESLLRGGWHQYRSDALSRTRKHVLINGAVQSLVANSYCAEPPTAGATAGGDPLARAATFSGPSTAS